VDQGVDRALQPVERPTHRTRGLKFANSCCEKHRGFMSRKKKITLMLVYLVATIQFVWCYLWLTRPYVNTLLYEEGRERMPFQGRVLMMVPMRWAHQSSALWRFAESFGKSHFWFPKPVAPEVLVQAAIDVTCLLLTGFLTTKIYQASSRRRLLTPVVYPLLLVVCGATYVMHTVQNFRFLYDLPSLTFFAAAMYLMYFRQHWIYFAGLFVLATINRETTLLLLPLYMLNDAVEEGRLRWQLMPRSRTLLVVVPLALVWGAWQIFIRHHFAQNASEFYPRINWNVKSLVVPQAWPQLLSACGYLLLFVVVTRRRINDPQLHAWLWLLPMWFVFMFVYGILIETRVFGELIPFVVCATTLIVEELLLARMPKVGRGAALEIAGPPEIREAA
jgi:hypothetical protein